MKFIFGTTRNSLMELAQLQILIQIFQSNIITIHGKYVSKWEIYQVIAAAHNIYDSRKPTVNMYMLY